MTANLSALVARSMDADGTLDTAVPGLALYRASGTSSLTASIGRPALCFVVQGAKEVQLGAETHRYEPGRCLLVSAELPMSSRIVEASRERPYLGISIALDHGVVCEVAAQVESPKQAGTVPALAVSDAEGPLLDAVTRLVVLHEARATERAVLTPLVMREIVFRLLASEHGQRVRQIAIGEGSAQRIFKALRWLQKNFAEPLRIDELAKDVHLSSSALHQHFKSVTAMSPLQYQKQLRLHEARRLMLSDGMDAATASFKVGYESPSQFSREYRRLFGAPPRQEIEGARKTLAAAVLAPAVEV
jgi:AraC-like DNA-binding protein